MKLKPDFRPEPGIRTEPKLSLYRIFRIFSYSSNIRSFIYSLVLLIVYGYIKNSQNDMICYVPVPILKTFTFVSIQLNVC